MKITQSLVLILLLNSLSSCFLADDYFLEYKEPKVSLKQKTQNEITRYIKTNLQNESYYKYGFSDLIIHKPNELILLDNLINDRGNSEINQKKLEQDINALETKIKKENIRYFIEMDHFFSVTNKTTKQIQLFETKFFLADSLKVTSITPLINIPLTHNRESIFADYFYERAIFYQGDYALSKSLSREFYSFFKEHIDTLQGLKRKSDFLLHILWICNEVKKTGSFDQNNVLSKLVVNRFKSDTTRNQYNSIKFSNLYEINESENLKGYYFFHKFSDSKKTNSDTLVSYIGFSPHYELTEIVPVQKPYDQYFVE